LITHF